MTAVELWRLLREDFAIHGRSWSRPGFQALAVHRFGVWQSALPTPLRPLGRLLYGALYFIMRNIYGIELRLGSVIGHRLLISHHVGIVVNAHVVVGNDCLFRHGITIGAPSHDRYKEAPTIGNDVHVGAGAIITGRVTIGDGTRIGGNAIVVHDVPPGSRVLSPLADIQPPLLDNDGGILHETAP